LSADFVADASVAVAWVAPPQAAPATRQLLDRVYEGDGIVVPALWPFEVANSILVLWRRDKITKDQYLDARMLIDGLAPVIDEEGVSVASGPTADLAASHHLTVYDAAYLELAIRRHLPLASRHADLNRAAKRHGVHLLL
jgi:predicted nucleic acid-binding protein